jgi:hypothetical protein
MPTRIDRSRGKKRKTVARGLEAIAVMFTALVMAAPVLAQGVGYQVISNDPSGLEIRFHGVPLRAVHADDNQNALSLDFQQPVDGAMFDHLQADVPQWISMAYANFDNGIIRSPRPVTFLTRAESDGFSLRIMARGGPAPAMAQNLPPPLRGPTYGPVQPYGPVQQQIWPPPDAAAPPPGHSDFHTYADYAELRNYEAQELAVRRGDPMWLTAYGRAAMQADSGIGLANEWNWYHGGDRMVSADLSGKLTFVPGMALVGDVTYANVTGNNVRLADGGIANTATSLVTGAGGLALEMGRDSELRLEASEGNDLTGGRATFYSGTPTGFGYMKVEYHAPDLDTPTAVNNRADTDDAILGVAGELWYGMWGSASGHYTRYGVHGDADVARTAGWDGSLRWQTNMGDGLLAGIAYDGHGDYLTSNASFTGAAPSPFIPLGIRSIENHAVTLNLSSIVWEGFWFSGYAGWVKDRYSSDGLLAGLDLHYMPAPGLDIALGLRQSAVSYTQGETGRQTTAGLNVTLGMGDPPQPSWMQNQP